MMYFTLLCHIVCLFYKYCRSHERTPEELEQVFEELLHIAALSHLSTSIKRELASIIVFEAHAQAGTICKFFRIFCNKFRLNGPPVIWNS